VKQHLNLYLHLLEPGHLVVIFQLVNVTFGPINPDLVIRYDIYHGYKQPKKVLRCFTRVPLWVMVVGR
jgi:hypothetical protein